MCPWLKEKRHQCQYAHVLLTNPNASCSDSCIVLCWSWSVVAEVVVVECCCCIPYRLVLMLVLTFAPCALTFAPCTCGVILPSTNACTPLAPMVLVTGCNWRWCGFPSAIGTLHQWLCHPLQLALVVFFLPPTSAHTPLVFEQLALCGIYCIIMCLAELTSPFHHAMHPEQ